MVTIRAAAIFLNIMVVVAMVGWILDEGTQDDLIGVVLVVVLALVNIAAVWILGRRVEELEGD